MANDDKPLGSTSEIPAVSRKPELETTLVGIEAQPLIVPPQHPPQPPPQQPAPPPPPPRREPTMEDVSRQQATNAIRVISEKNPWLALVLHYIVTASAALLVVGGASLKLGWLSIGPELGGPNPKQLDVLQKRLDSHEDKLDQFLIKIGDSESGICGQIPIRVDELKAANRILDKDMKSLSRQRFQRLFYLFADVIDNACAEGGRGWKRKWHKELDKGYEEEEDFVFDE